MQEKSEKVPSTFNILVDIGKFKMMQKKTLAIALVWFLVASLIMMSSYAATSDTESKATDQVFHPLAGKVIRISYS